MNIIKYQIKPTGKLSKREFAEVWGVRSDTRPDKIYTVALTKKGAWSCGCPRWTQNASRPECKHIRKIKQFRESGFAGQYDDQTLPEAVEEKLSRFSMVEV